MHQIIANEGCILLCAAPLPAAPTAAGLSVVPGLLVV
jgi:hypothetical protein